MIKLKELEQWYASGDVMKLTGRTKQGAINLIKKGRVRGVKTRAGWLYDPKSVEEFLQKEEPANPSLTPPPPSQALRSQPRGSVATHNANRA